MLSLCPDLKMNRYLRLLPIGFLLAFASAAFAQPGQPAYLITGTDGTPVANHRVAAELARDIERLPGIVIAGNPKGDVTLVEFYDLNCPYCRRAASDLDAMLKTDKDLRLVLVPFPVLGVPSILASRVELAVRKIATPQQFYEFHHKLYAGRGVIDGNRALAAAKDMNLDTSKLISLANEDDITETMKAHVRLGNALKLMATPAYVIKDVAILGHPGRAPLERATASVRKCGRVVC
ncbi:MAG: DsbA family protein [Rhizobiales bacterium]|nr:DsbA family protein [Hyphomicrobiales bacterium]